ncbi:hypothetical protein [Paracoccus sp. (in: a-proteobacteria)]|uniref:hypothetical protein n=1 Tax=Paracoccus sp. TaxID=267 RepID=UPI003220844F
MRNELNASEKRLTAALERIDRHIEKAVAARGKAAEGEAAGDEALRQENRRLSQELVALHESQGASLAACEARLAEAHQRLVTAGQEAAGLSAANEALAAANRALLEAAGEPAERIRAAFEAEIESLRAARAAEVGQLGDMLATLERMDAQAELALDADVERG